jgi:uncharacterized protein YggT (Ycf19 family)
MDSNNIYNSDNSGTNNSGNSPGNGNEQVRSSSQIAYQFIWYLLGILESLLVIRFILKLLGANSAASFTSFIYNISYPFVSPFLNVFRSTLLKTGVFEWNAILAILVYWLLAWAIAALIMMGKPLSSDSEQKASSMKLRH